MVTADDVAEPLNAGDNVTVAEMSELDSCDADNSSSVIAVDNAMLVPHVETSACPPNDDNSVVISPAAVNDVVECSAAEHVVSTQSELVSSSPSKLTDASFDDSDRCDVKKADKTENVGNMDVGSVAVCETVDKTGCDAVVTDSLPLSSENPVTFPPPPTDVGEVISGDDINDPDGMQLDVAECIEIGDTAD